MEKSQREIGTIINIEALITVNYLICASFYGKKGGWQRILNFFQINTTINITTNLSLT